MPDILQEHDWTLLLRRINDGKCTLSGIDWRRGSVHEPTAVASSANVSTRTPVEGIVIDERAARLNFAALEVCQTESETDS